MSYTTLSQLKAYAGIVSSDDDALLTDLIARAQEMIDAAAGRTFECAADGERRLDAEAGVEGSILWLDRDLCQITRVVNGDGVEVLAGEYVTEPRGDTPYYALRLLASSGKEWTYATDAENAIAITGRWAYSLTAPKRIEQLCIEAATALYRLRDNPVAVRLVVDGGVVANAADVASYISSRVAQFGLIRY